MEPSQPKQAIPSQPRFAFFGTPYVARDTLTYLVAQGFTPALVITSPDAKKGRGMQLAPSDTKVFAMTAGLAVIAPEKLDSEAISDIEEYGCEYAVVVAYGKILPQKLIEAFPKGVLNVHYSLLPNYRGASPVETALFNGDEKTGVSVQKMVKALDAGDILAEQDVYIDPNDTTLTLRPRLIETGRRLLVDSLPGFLAGTATFTPQNPALATTCAKIAKEDGELDFPGPALPNWNKYRAYAESPGTFFYMTKDDKPFRVKVKTALYEHGEFTPLRVIPEGKRETDYRALLMYAVPGKTN